jgi:hypothetical protein
MMFIYRSESEIINKNFYRNGVRSLKKLNVKSLFVPVCASLLLVGCMEEGRMSPEEEDVDVVDPGMGENEDNEEESN